MMQITELLVKAVCRPLLSQPVKELHMRHVGVDSASCGVTSHHLLCVSLS